MVKHLVEMQKIVKENIDTTAKTLAAVSKDNLEVTVKSFGEVSKSAQAIASHITDYSKQSFEDGSKVMEKLFGAKSLEQAIEIQSEYAKASYERFVTEATKIGELCANLVKETYKSFENNLSKAASMR
jgi:hypothetical protein